MKDKKIIVIILIIVALLIIAICIIFFRTKKQEEKSENTESIAEIEKAPDKVIKGTEKNSIKKGDFEVTSINIFKNSETNIDVQATIVNNSKEAVSGFFIEIGLFDKKGKQISVVTENHQKDIAPNEKYILVSNVDARKKEIEKIDNAKIINLEKDTKTVLEGAFDNTDENVEQITKNQ